MFNMRSSPEFWLDDLEDPYLLDDEDLAFTRTSLDDYLKQHDLYEEN